MIGTIGEPRGTLAHSRPYLPHMIALTQIADVSAQLSSNPASALPLLFGAGVLTSLTPCIYPMIPITAAIVGGQSSSEQSGAR